MEKLAIDGGTPVRTKNPIVETDFFTDEELDAVVEVMKSNKIRRGAVTLEYEKLIAEKLHVKHALAVTSGTTTLHIAMAALGIGPGDEVIIPAYTYAATALVVMHVGATPVMVDVKDDFNIDVDEIRKKVTTKTKAIIPVDVAGWPCDYDGIYNLANEPGIRKLFEATTETQKKLGRILILSDAAHSIGAVYQNKAIGTWGDFAVFSFHAVKNVTTAEGGAICINLPKDEFNHESIYKQLKLWSLNGQTKDALSKTNGAGWKYDIVYPGFKMNMPDICAAIGLAQLKKYKTQILPARKRVFDLYVLHFNKYHWVQLPPLDSIAKISSYHLFALRIIDINEAVRDRMIELITTKGVSVNVHFQPLPLLTLFKSMGYSIADYPKSFNNYSREISLPIYPGLEEKVEYIVNCVAEAYQEANG